MTLKQDLLDLMMVPGLSGHEQRIRAAIRARLPKGLHPTTDALGNLTVSFPGHGPRVMLFTHMDQLGFIVRKVEADGSLRVERLGGVPERALAGQAVVAMLCGHVHLNRLRIWQGLPVVTSIGLHATIDPLAPCEMVIEEGTGFALCDHGAEGLEVTFVPLTPERRVLKRIGHDVLRSFD